MLSLGDAFRLPWPSKVNPFARQLAGEGIRGLVESCHDAGMGAAASLCSEMSRAAAHILPHANWPLLVACHAWLVWFVLFDDAIETDTSENFELLENDKPRHQVLFDLFAKGIMPRGAEPFAWLGAEVRRRILPALSPTESALFFATVENYMLCGARPAMLWREAGHEPSPAAYETVRVYDVGLLPVVALMEASLGLSLTPEARNTADAQRAWRAGARIVAWVNDIISFDREQQRGDVCNVLLVLMHSGLTLMQARKLVDTHIAADVAVLEDLRKRGDSDPLGPPQAYYEGLTTLVRGCVDAHEGLERYADDVPSSRVARQVLLDRPTLAPGRSDFSTAPLAINPYGGVLSTPPEPSRNSRDRGGR